MGDCAGSALTTFNKGNVNLNPKVIAHRSSATRGEMLVNSRAYRQFCHKARINDSVPSIPCPTHVALASPILALAITVLLHIYACTRTTSVPPLSFMAHGTHRTFLSSHVVYHGLRGHSSPGCPWLQLCRGAWGHITEEFFVAPWYRRGAAGSCSWTRTTTTTRCRSRTRSR